jgi:membrane-bound serine protease (ClpP class)
VNASPRKLARSLGAALALLGGLWVALAAGNAPGAGSPGAGSPSGVQLHIRGPIGPAVSDFFVRELRKADDSDAALVVVTIDTPGGLDTSMRDMIQAILAADVPVVMYVSPSGARAASAGTYLLYASHVAAMAPGTNLGAATPIQIGGPGGGDAPAPAKPSAPESPAAAPEPPDAKTEQPPMPANAAERKAVNDAVAYLRSLAELRGRNADWAERAVREGASLSNSQALAMNVIDLVANDLTELLAALDGREIKLPSRTVKLSTSGLVLHDVQPDWRTELLALLTNPNVAYILMLIGIYGLIAEAYNPGVMFPGVIGAICLLLALFAFQVLSVNYAGLALIVLGVLLIVAESFVPAFGSLGLGGVVAFVIGSVMLLDSEVPGFGIASELIGAMAFVGALVLVAIVYFALRARRQPQASGENAMLKEPAEAVEPFEREGMVRVRGELWRATSPQPVRAGQRLRIVRIDGLTLEVEPLHD